MSRIRIAEFRICRYGNGNIKRWWNEQRTKNSLKIRHKRLICVRNAHCALHIGNISAKNKSVKIHGINRFYIQFFACTHIHDFIWWHPINKWESYSNDKLPIRLLFLTLLCISLLVQLNLFKLVIIARKKVHILSWIQLSEIGRIIYVCFDCMKVTKTKSWIEWIATLVHSYTNTACV